MNILVNEVRADGFRRVVAAYEAGEKMNPLAVVPRYCAQMAVVSLLPREENIYEVRWQVFGPVDFGGCGFRARYFMVHRVYGVGIRDCVRLAVEGWQVGAQVQPRYGYVRKLPAGVEEGFEVLGVALLEADWVFDNCVAVK